jgi:hypothetical protein
MTDNDRIEKVIRIFEKMERILENSELLSQFPELWDVSDFLDKYGANICIPRQSGSFECVRIAYDCSDDIDPETMLIVYPMLSEDVKFGGFASFAMQSVEFAGHGKENNLVILNLDYGETPMMYAVGFIHEIKHLIQAERNGLLFKNNSNRREEDMLKDEVEVWTCDYRLVLAMAGRVCMEAVEDMARQLYEWWFMGGNKPSQIGKGVFLDNALEKPLAQSHISRDNEFLAYCTLFAVDKYLSPKEAIDEKCRLLSSWLGYSKLFAEKQALLRSVRR